MKKLISFVLMLAVSLAALTMTAFCADPAVFPAMATNNTIVVSSSADEPDAHVVSPAVYKIEGANYFRLRDVAMLLNGSEKQFAVEYDEAEKTVSLTSGQPYRAVGGELSGAASETASAGPTNNAILIGGEIVTLTVYTNRRGELFQAPGPRPGSGFSRRLRRRDKDGLPLRLQGIRRRDRLRRASVRGADHPYRRISRRRDLPAGGAHRQRGGAEPIL